MSTENARRILQRDPQPHLLRPFTMRSVLTRNRIMMSPMCQYSAQDGLADDWHFAHLAARAVGGAGIVCVEASHVEPRGRITKQCLGLWNDEQRDRLARIAAFITGQGAFPPFSLPIPGVRARCRGRGRARCLSQSVRARGKQSRRRRSPLAIAPRPCAPWTMR